MRRGGIPLYSVNSQFLRYIKATEAYDLQAAGEAWVNQRGRIPVSCKLRDPRREPVLNGRVITPTEMLANAGVIGSQQFQDEVRDKVAVYTQV